MPDSLKFYDLERYLLNEVGPKFRETGEIKPVDFFMIFIWKAARAKTLVRNRLKRRADSFTKAVTEIATSLRDAKEQKSRLKILIQDFRFRLPMASAILTILYPDEFTVYDRRVCKELGFPYQEWQPPLGNIGFDRCWDKYMQLKESLINNTPADLSLRDKDRYLWARSLRKDAERDCVA